MNFCEYSIYGSVSGTLVVKADLVLIRNLVRSGSVGIWILRIRVFPADDIQGVVYIQLVVGTYFCDSGGSFGFFEYIILPVKLGLCPAKVNAGSKYCVAVLAVCSCVILNSVIEIMYLIA